MTRPRAAFSRPAAFAPRPALAALLLAALPLAVAPAPALGQDFNAAPPNAATQRPAFPGQTRAPVLPATPPLATATIARLDEPWGMVLLPSGDRLVTEKRGRMRLVSPAGEVSPAVEGLPQVDARGQGGLLDVTIRPGFEGRRVWWSFSEPRGGGRNSTSVATGRLSQDGARLEQVRVIFRQEPAWASTRHFGSRLEFDREGMLFVTTGERGGTDSRGLAQDPAGHLGKVLRIDPEGGPAQEAAASGWAPEVWSIGHRNLQAAAMDPAGRLWTVEHGPRGGDELNRPERGRNHGWPQVSYGEEYSGAPVGDGVSAAEGVEQPLYYWDPVIAPSGMEFYRGAMFPEWEGDILIGGLRGAALVRLRLDGDRVAGEARHLQGIGRVRDVDVDPDGAVILLVGDRLVRVTRGG